MASKDVHISILATDKTARAFASVKGGLVSVSKSAIAVGARVAKVGAAMTAATVAAGIALTKTSMANVDALAKTADKIGVTTEALAGLQHAAELTGVSTETMNMALQRMTRRVAEAALGTGEAVKALKELRIDAGALVKLPLDKQMEVVADAMQGVGTQADRVRLAMKLFDSEGVALVNTLAGGSVGLQEMAAEAEHLGIAISRVDAAQIEAANDAVTRAKGVFTGLGNQLATAFSPIIKEVADNFRLAALDSAEFGNVGQQVADYLVKSYASVQDKLFEVTKFLLWAKMVTFEWAASFAEVGAAVNRVLSPVESLIRMYNWIAQMAGKDTFAVPSEQLMAFSESARASAEETKRILHDMMAQPLPSVGILDTYEKIKVAAREAAQTVADNAPGKVLEEAEVESLKKRTAIQNWNDQLRADGAKKLAAFDRKLAHEKTQYVLGEALKQTEGLAKNSKKMFAVQKAFRIATALMNTYAAATTALAAYPPPLGAIMAALTVASGLAQVSQIKAQSFEGGGFTGMGSRSGGVDGKGGFGAILHPNESIIDHTKGQGMGGITVVNNIDATGAGADVDMKIRAAMEQTSAYTVATINDLMKRRRFG